jgi:hypothetical protein
MEPPPEVEVWDCGEMAIYRRHNPAERIGDRTCTIQLPAVFGITDISLNGYYCGRNRSIPPLSSGNRTHLPQVETPDIALAASEMSFRRTASDFESGQQKEICAYYSC